MANLVLDNEVYQYLGITKEIDDPNGQALLIRDAVEELLAGMTGQVFGASATLTDAAFDGTGTSVLYVDRPLSALTSIKFVNPFDLSDQDDVDITQDVTWQVGKRRIALRSMKFPSGRNNVLITYQTQANQPAIAKQAVRDAVAVIFRRMGSEDARSEQVGTFQHVLLRKLEESMSWQKAVDLLSIPSLG